MSKAIKRMISELGNASRDDSYRPASAARLRSSVNVKEAEASTARVRTANALIDRRVFSWTELLSRLEKTLPDNARITAIKPKTEAGQTVLALSVLARGVEDVNRFMENLDETRAFADLHSRQEQTTEEGFIESSLEMVYRPTPSSAPEGGVVPTRTSAPDAAAAGGAR